jgi:hypothetical protein
MPFGTVPLAIELMRPIDHEVAALMKCHEHNPDRIELLL